VYKVKFYRKASKSFKKIPREYKTKIKNAADKLSIDPFVLDIKKLNPPNEASHRLRVGAYRLFIDIDTSSKVIIIVDIKRRTTQTYQ